MKMIVLYDRIPEVPFLKFPTKGKPNQVLLYPYSKNYGFRDFGLNTKPHTRGGATTVCLVDETSAWMLTGKTICSMSDNFSYREGRERALLRATNLGLGHDDLDNGVMYRLDDWNKLDAVQKVIVLEFFIRKADDKTKIKSNTLYFHPETAEITPIIADFKYKTSKIILKNHVWIGFEE